MRILKSVEFQPDVQKKIWYNAKAGTQLSLRLYNADMGRTKKSTLPIFKYSMLFLDKLLIQKEINHVDIQNAVIIIPTLSNIFPYHNFRERISCERKWSEFYISFLISRHRIRRLDIGSFSS